MTLKSLTAELLGSFLLFPPFRGEKKFSGGMEKDLEGEVFSQNLLKRVSIVRMRFSGRFEKGSLGELNSSELLSPEEFFPKPGSSI